MARSKTPRPTELELEILKVLWRDGPLAVREVRKALAAGKARRRLAHTSVITMLNIMADKGFVSRTKQGKAFIFKPRVAEKQVSRGMLSDIVNRVFDGSSAAVMVQLLETASIDADEIEQLRKLINRKAKEQQE